MAVVHRPGRDDWSLPKGKLAPDESFEECALREVQEETGLRCRLRRFVGSTEYRDRRDRPKIVAYWLMDALDGEFAPSDEVDEMRWLELTIARRALTYERDRDLLAPSTPLVPAAIGSGGHASSAVDAVRSGSRCDPQETVSEPGANCHSPRERQRSSRS